MLSMMYSLSHYYIPESTSVFSPRELVKGLMINSLVLNELSWPLQIAEHKTSKIAAGQCSTIPGYTADVSIQAIRSREFQTDEV